MKVVIMGCGRMGASLAAMLDTDGHDVTVLDVNADAFERLPLNFRGRAMVGNGTDEEAQRRARADEADAFVCVTAGDNRNLMAAQIAKHIFHVPRVVCRIYDPIRNDIFHNIGLETMSPTILGAQRLFEMVSSGPAPAR